MIKIENDQSPHLVVEGATGAGVLVVVLGPGRAVVAAGAGEVGQVAHGAHAVVTVVAWRDGWIYKDKRN